MIKLLYIYIKMIIAKVIKEFLEIDGNDINMIKLVK